MIELYLRDLYDDLFHNFMTLHQKYVKLNWLCIAVEKNMPSIWLSKFICLFILHTAISLLYSSTRNSPDILWNFGKIKTVRRGLNGSLQCHYHFCYCLSTWSFKTNHALLWNEFFKVTILSCLQSNTCRPKSPHTISPHLTFQNIFIDPQFKIFCSHTRTSVWICVSRTRQPLLIASRHRKIKIRLNRTHIKTWLSHTVIPRHCTLQNVNTSQHHTWQLPQQ